MDGQHLGTHQDTECGNAEDAVTSLRILLPQQVLDVDVFIKNHLHYSRVFSSGLPASISIILAKRRVNVTGLA